MNFPGAVKVEDMPLRIQEWVLAGYLIEGISRGEYRNEYEPGEPYWKLFVIESKCLKAYYVRRDLLGGWWTRWDV